MLISFFDSVQTYSLKKAQVPSRPVLLLLVQEIAACKDIILRVKRQQADWMHGNVHNPFWNLPRASEIEQMNE